MHTVYFSYQPASDFRQSSPICCRSLLWGEQWFYSLDQLIEDLKSEGMPYQLIDVDMLSEMPDELGQGDSHEPA